MIIFKILLIILLSAPVIAAAVFLYVQARDYSVKLNREEKYKKMFKENQFGNPEGYRRYR